MVLKEMVNIIIFYTHSSKEKAMKLFSKFNDNLNNSKVVMAKNDIILTNDCFVIRVLPLIENNYRGIPYNLAYIPTGVDYEIECHIRAGGHMRNFEKY